MEFDFLWALDLQQLNFALTVVLTIYNMNFNFEVSSGTSLYWKKKKPLVNLLLQNIYHYAKYGKI